MKLRVPRSRPRFPLGAPRWPGGVPRPPVERTTGVDYDTDWARQWPARVARVGIVEALLRPAVRVLADPRVYGVDRIASVDEPVIFVANHHSHLDTPLLLTAIPERFRHRTVVAAGADYFFTSRVRAAASALAMGAIPIERLKVSRRSADLAARLLDEGWSLMIFPEGGRSPDGWAQAFRAGAAYLSLRTGRAVVPVHIEGSRRVMKKGDRWPTPSTVSVTFGSLLRPDADGGEDARRFASRIDRAVAALADEQATDWWTSRRRAASGTTPALTGPESVAPWRRAWALRGPARPPRRTWP